MCLNVNFKNQNYIDNCILFYDQISDLKKSATKLKDVDTKNLISLIDNKIIDKYKIQILNFKSNQKIFIVKLKLGESSLENEKINI